MLNLIRNPNVNPKDPFYLHEGNFKVRRCQSWENRNQHESPSVAGGRVNFHRWGRRAFSGKAEQPPSPRFCRSTCQTSSRRVLSCLLPGDTPENVQSSGVVKAKTGEQPECLHRIQKLGCFHKMEDYVARKSEPTAWGGGERDSNTMSFFVFVLALIKHNIKGKRSQKED